MAVVVSIAILIFLYSFLKVAYDTISCYWLTPRRIKKTNGKTRCKWPETPDFGRYILDMTSLVAESTSKDMDSIHHDIVGRLLPHFTILVEDTWYVSNKIYSFHVVEVMLHMIITNCVGKKFIYWNGIEPRMCLTELPELIKELLSKYSTISGKSWQQQQGSKHFIGRGLLMANGDDWYHQRHIVAKAFMGDKLKSYAGYMVECTRQMLKSLENAMETGKTEVEIGEYMTRLTADIISRTEFDSNYEKGKQIFHLLSDLQRLCAQASRHLWFPGSRFFPSKYNREIKSRKMEVETLLMEIIQSRKDCVEIGRSKSYGNDLVRMLLSEMKKKRESTKFSLNLQYVMDECKTFFFAGHETSALLLTWTVMLLASNPIWQEKVREELKQVCNNGGEPSVDQLSKLTLLSMVINESLRLYPPASVLPRMAFEDIKLGELFIPKGLSIWIPVLAIHHNEEIWGKDVNEFNPSRFASKSYTPGRHFIPFATGPRNCVGQSFALMEAKIILSMLISRFSFTISENYRHAPIIVLTIKPKYGVQICLKPLN